MTGDHKRSAFQENWWVFQRLQDTNAAVAINYVRAAGVFAFYAIHLLNYYSLKEVTKDQQTFHFYATWIFAGWLALCCVTFLAIHFRHLPPHAKYLSTNIDLLFLTAAIAIGAGPSSWLVQVYLLIIASTIIRFDIRLVIVATLVSVVAYIFLVGKFDQKWFDANHETPLSQVFITLTTILLTGALGVLAIRSVRSFIRLQSESNSSEGANNE